MPMPPYPQAQVTRTATYILSIGGAEADGTPDGNVNWNSGLGIFTCPKIFGSGPGSVSYKTYMFLNGSSTPSDGEDEPDVPDLVSAAWIWQARLFSLTDPTGPYALSGGAPTVSVQIGANSDSATCVHTPGDPPSSFRPQTIGSVASIPDFSPLDWKLGIGSGSAGQGDRGLMSCDNPPSFFESAGMAFDLMRVVGGATWLAWWWKLSDSDNQKNGGGKDNCGNAVPKAPFIYRRTDPSEATGFQWEKFDPEDSTAHPTPVIVSLEPDHGRVQGGDTVTIRGSGFGTEATVSVDGSDIDADKVDIIDSETIQFVTPVHISGYVSVVVTNFDGVSS